MKIYQSKYSTKYYKIVQNKIIARYIIIITKGWNIPVTKNIKFSLLYYVSVKENLSLNSFKIL